MELIMFNFIIHLLSLILTIASSVYVYFLVHYHIFTQLMGYLVLIINLTNIINLLPLFIKDLVYLKWKVTKKIELRNKHIAEKFLLKLKTKNESKNDNTIFSDMINSKGPITLEEVSEEEYKKYKDQRLKEYIDNELYK